MEVITTIDTLFTQLENKDDKVRYAAFQELLSITEQQVEWIYDKWYPLLDKLSSENSYQRSIGIMLLANLSKSDTENRFFSILDNYLIFFEDEKFITSRQCIQNVWKIAVHQPITEKKVLEALEETYYHNCHLSAHANLIKQDVISSMDAIYQKNRKKEIRDKVNTLIDSETDDKLKKSLAKMLK